MRVIDVKIQQNEKENKGCIKLVRAFPCYGPEFSEISDKNHQTKFT